MNLKEEVEGEGDEPERVFTDKEKDLLAGATSAQIKAYGRLDQSTLEGMLVGYLIGMPNTEKHDTSAAQKILEAGITAEWFEEKFLGALFDDFISHFRDTRTLLNVDEVSQVCINLGQTKDQAGIYVAQCHSCLGALKSRKIRAELLILRFMNHHLQKEMDKIYQESVKMRSDPSQGPQKAWEHMRNRAMKDLADARGAPLKEFNFSQDLHEVLGWLKDMKHNPDQYKGIGCGIDIIDLKTQGFRPGQLCVFVGKPGGYKTTMMINVAHGLWKNDANVLYASLEMESKNLMLKMLCRATKLSYSRLYNGEIIEKDTAGDQSDEAKIEQYNKAIQGRKNKFVVLNAGQSEKIKMSQLEKWLYQQASQFKPDVVFLDYLSLLSPEVLNQDRLDVGYGDICKMSRAMGKSMGFSTVTAAQIKRAALERLRKTGYDSPDKALFDTDDIAESNMIGADADNVFVLWTKDRTELNIYTVKCRYGEISNQKPAVLQIDYDTCTIADNTQIESTEAISAKKSMGDAYKSLDTMGKPNYPTIPGEEEEDEMGVGLPTRGTTDMEETIAPDDAPTEQDADEPDPVDEDPDL
jgi:replicative DNA helicase